MVLFSLCLMVGFVGKVAKLLDYDVTAEAAIINYYPNSKSVMGGHVDDAELDMSKPIVSCSFGNTVGSVVCIVLILVFLVGGLDRTTKPHAVFIRSGDIVLLSGHTRSCYHGVPRMIDGTCPSAIITDTDDEEREDELWQTCKEYITHARINMNCRQVIPDGTTRIDEAN